MNTLKLIRYENCHQVFACPVCHEPLSFNDHTLTCKNRHGFDLSKYGYVNLLLNNQNKNTYDKHSFEHRQLVLENGLYDHVLNEIVAFINNTPRLQTVLDSGCGEGFYARRIAHLTNADVWAADISKDSIQLAARSDSDYAVKWFVADVAHLPVLSNSLDCILDIFSLANYGEFHRILKKDGMLVKIIPGNEHLKELRMAARKHLKQESYSNQQIIAHFEKHFALLERKQLTKQYPVTAEIRDAFIHMTPLLFHVDKKQIDWSSVEYITIDAEILFGCSELI